MIVRRARAEDREDIAEIQEASPEAAQWDALEFICLVAVLDNRVIGFIVVRESGHQEREILNLAVHPDHRKKGAGRLLIEEERKSSPGVRFLEVRESNEGAIALYRSMGFRPCGVRKNYYIDPPETAIVMKFDSWYRHGAQPESEAGGAI